LAAGGESSLERLAPPSEGSTGAMRAAMLAVVSSCLAASALDDERRTTVRIRSALP
jgi:hypothetical protein